MFSENKRIIIGGLGSGKSKLLDSLRAKGFPTATEAGRAIIRDQVGARLMVRNGYRLSGW
ncbi:AAA family ATPase [Providencia sp. SP181]|uniref:AAA family ATPase n=1 Tax=Providencia sp. SP181 TaxID=3136277 RepID=UPI003D2DD3C9